MLLIPERLLGILSYIDCRALADIGADHALVPIAACLSGKCKKAVACDINKLPLERAAENIRLYGLEDKIETRLGDGLAPIKPGEADCVVIAGVGGRLIESIISKGAGQARKAQTIIMQPMHDVPFLRKSLHRLGFEITDENITKEGNRFYQTVIARPANSAIYWKEKEYLTGRRFPGNEAFWGEYARHETDKLTKNIEAIEKNFSNNETTRQKLHELYYLRELYANLTDAQYAPLPY
jgi:tRNA (adenine22-N1)-methyltransferase